MSEVVKCPACGGPARASRTGVNAAGESTLVAVTDEAKDEKIAQLKEAVGIQKELLDAANQRIRDLEAMLRQGSVRPGIPPVPPARPDFPNAPFQGRLGAL